MIKAVLDTSIFICAAKSTKPASSAAVAVVDAIETGEFQCVWSPALLKETIRVFIERGVGREIIAMFAARLHRSGRQVADTPPLATDVCRDPEDVYLVTLARHSAADWLVSHDLDVLEIPSPPCNVGRALALLTAMRAAAIAVPKPPPTPSPGAPAPP